ncbi:hypothetical protein O3M35_007355 [Rhynocoris fuscipes]|uniref:uS12 prolyl 3-hydroxylase n=1 Tax=Rhynocoris fuscipes TaxID=488301 RepID=A0AAW1DBM9_9HEMI
MSKSETPVLNDIYNDCQITNNIKKKYRDSSTCILENYELINSPFRLLKLTDLISDSSFKDLLIKDLKELEFIRKDNDLYNLRQSCDLNNCNVESISKFVVLLRSKIEPLLSTIMGVTFNGTLSVTASLYRSGEYLLCHDDRCDDRCVAFVYYLTESENEAGGHFRMFEHNVENGQPTRVSCSLPPKANSLICFEVGNYTYHEVGEVLDENFERLSINGWFHSDSNLNKEGLNYIDPMPRLYPQISPEAPLTLNKYINKTYCAQSNIVLAQEQFEKDSFILLSDFFVSDFFKTCAESMKEITSWEVIGPANRRRYECSELESLPGPLQIMINLIRSPMFISYLKDITGLDLIPNSDEEENDKCTEMTLQIQKWTNGSYTMATDNDAFFHKSGLDMIFYFNSDLFCRGEDNYGGCTVYLASGESDSDSVSLADDSELLTVEPQDNALVLIYRTSDTVRFTKYINHYNSGLFHAISATYFEPET